MCCRKKDRVCAGFQRWSWSETINSSVTVLFQVFYKEDCLLWEAVKKKDPWEIKNKWSVPYNLPSLLPGEISGPLSTEKDPDWAYWSPRLEKAWEFSEPKKVSILRTGYGEEKTAVRTPDVWRGSHSSTQLSAR